MTKYLVQKSDPLRGEVVISGSKNAVLPILAASLLTSQRCEIYDVPALKDVDIMCDMLRELGSSVVENLEENQVITQTGTIATHVASSELVKKM